MDTIAQFKKLKKMKKTVDKQLEFLRRKIIIQAKAYGEKKGNEWYYKGVKVTEKCTFSEEKAVDWIESEDWVARGSEFYWSKQVPRRWLIDEAILAGRLKKKDFYRFWFEVTVEEE